MFEQTSPNMIHRFSPNFMSSTLTYVSLLIQSRPKMSSSIFCFLFNISKYFFDNKRSHELAEGEFRSSDVKLKSLHPASSVAVSERNGPADRFLACNIASLVAKREETNQRTLILLPLSLCLLCHRRRST